MPEQQVVGEATSAVLPPRFLRGVATESVGAWRRRSSEPGASRTMIAQRGFTLVELMVVLAMIAVLSALAVAYTGEQRANLKNFGGQILGECDTAKMRALSSRRWHRIRFEDGMMITEQATFTGMVEPDDDEWSQVGQAAVPKRFTVHAITTTADVDTGNAPGEGDGLDEALVFAPDGSSVARTVYLSTQQPATYLRIVIYRATGTAYMKENW